MSILGMIGDLSQYLTNTTTLNLFKKNHKGPITGLELGLQTTSIFTKIQKHLKILDFRF